MFFVIIFVIIVAGIYVYKCQRDKVEELASKIKKSIPNTANVSNIFLSKKLNDEFSGSEQLENAISNINRNGLEYVEIYPDRMEYNNQVLHFKFAGIEKLESIGECKALANFVQSNLRNKSRYDIDEIPNFYSEGYSECVGYSIIDKNKKYNV